MWITNMTVAVCMSCTNKTHWEKAERISTEQRFTQLRPWQSSLGPGLKCIESGDIWRIADHLVHNYEEVISNIFKRSWNMNMEYVYIYIILSICIFTHFIPTVLTNLSTFGRSKAPNTAVIRVALFRIDTSGRGVLPHWCHGTGLWFMDSTCAMDWSGMFTSDLQISGIYIIYTVVYIIGSLYKWVSSKISKSTSQFWDHSKLLWKSERCFMRFAAINMFSGPVPATHEPWRVQKTGATIFSTFQSHRHTKPWNGSISSSTKHHLSYHLSILHLYIYIMYIHTYNLMASLLDSLKPSFKILAVLFLLEASAQLRSPRARARRILSRASRHVCTSRCTEGDMKFIMAYLGWNMSIYTLYNILITYYINIYIYIHIHIITYTYIMPDIHMTHIFENVAYLAKKYVCVLYIIYIYPCVHGKEQMLRTHQPTNNNTSRYTYHYILQ